MCILKIRKKLTDNQLTNVLKVLVNLTLKLNIKIEIVLYFEGKYVVRTDKIFWEFGLKIKDLDHLEDL